MNVREAYIFIFGLLDGYWEKTHDRNLGDILSEMTLWHPLSSDEKPADPAFQGDWADAVKKVTDHDSITDTQALQAAYYFLEEYNEHQGFDLKKPMSFLKDKLDKHDQPRKLGKETGQHN